ncbi:MAG: hypothetical protein ABI131_06870 [Nostocoides sp.]
MTTPPAGPGRRTGALLQGVVVAAALWLLAVAALCVPLGGLGWWNPLLVWPVVVLLLWPCWRVARRVPSAPVGRGVAALLVGVAVASTVWLGVTHAEQVLPRRDAGSNLQAAVSLAETHRRVVSVAADSVGGSAVLQTPGITLASPAFYQVGSATDPAVQPQFVVGPAAVLSLGYWIGGVTGALLVPALLTGLMLLGLGVLVCRVVGPRWGPVAAAVTALVFPVVHTGRSTLSESLADLALVGALLTLAAAAAAESREGAVAGWAGAVAGLLVGATMLLRADALRETVLLTVVGALALVQRRAFAGPMLRWAWGSTAYGLLAALWLSYRYVGDIAASLVPLVAGALVVGVGAVAVVALSRRGVGLPTPVVRVLPARAAVGTVLVGVLLASRPGWQTVRQDPNDPGARFVAGLQLRQGLPVDGGRTYAEHTVGWLAWWIGWPALVVALVALAVLVRAIAVTWTAGRALPAWSGPLLVAAGSTVLTLYRPGITPDHPWADRRLLIALVFVVVLVVAAAGWLLRWVCDRWGAWAGRGVALVVVLGLAIPTTLATWPHRGERVEAGSASAVTDVCAALEPGDVVLAVDGRAANEWPQVVRGECGIPALSTTTTLRKNTAFAATVSAVAAAVAAHGGRLVLLAADSDDVLKTLGAQGIRQVSTVTVHEDERLLTRRPNALVALPVDVWLATPAAPAAPAAS